MSDGRLGSNADLQNAGRIAPQVGQVLGGPVGQGIGQIISTAISLFGGKTHTTPGGETYHEATSTFKANEMTIEALTNQYNAAHGLPQVSFTPPPTNGDSPAYYQWMSQRVAYYLGQPSLVTSSAKAYDKLKSGGAFDSAIQVQDMVLQQLAAGQAPSTTSDASATVAPAAGSLSLPTLLLCGASAIVLFKVLEG